MNIQENISLAQYSTMRLGGNGRYCAIVSSRSDIEEAVNWAAEHQVPVIMVGGGSNIVWRDEGFNGLLLVNRISGYQDFAEDEANHYLTIGAGENWDSVVDRAAGAGLTGIEALSLIPGTTGATPIQNVGAYGQEIADTLVSVEAYDLQTRQFINIPAGECGFGYRTSRFKTTDRGRFLISGITLHLLAEGPKPPFYAALTEYFKTNNITAYTPMIVRLAVMDIRAHKLPDPATIANNGSFFANPIIDRGTLSQIQSTYPDIPHWETDDPQLVKLPAAWMIERAGFKDFKDPETGMATWAAQPLVLVNEHARSTADLLAFKQKIVDAVSAEFGVTLSQEPELLP